MTIQCKLIIFSVGLKLILTLCPCRANYFYIKPTTAGSENCHHNSEWSCKTLDDYADNSTIELDNKNNVTMIFLPGEHNLTKELHVMGTENLTLVGCVINDRSPMPGSVKHLKSIRIILLQFNLVLDGFSRVNISDLLIDGRCKNRIMLLTQSTTNVVVNMDSVTLVGSVLLIKPQNAVPRSKTMVVLSNMIFNGSTLMVSLANTNNITVKDVIFYLGPGNNALTFCSIMSHICLLYTSPSPRDATLSRMPSSA